jgi:hypothetical protein
MAADVDRIARRWFTASKGAAGRSLRAQSVVGRLSVGRREMHARRPGLVTRSNLLTPIWGGITTARSAHAPTAKPNAPCVPLVPTPRTYEEHMHMSIRRPLAALSAALTLALAAPASAHAPSDPPSVRELATFGTGLGSGGTIGPDGALYVTDGNAGAVLRVDTRSGGVTTYATGLPKQVLGIGGAMDVVFRGRTAYVLVTMVGGDLLVPGGPVPFGDDVVGIYRLNKDGTFTVVADLGAYSAAHPPTTDFFITTGVHYSIDTYRDGFVVADGHHNRVLRVGRDGSVDALATLGNVVPTGLETGRGDVLASLAGPIPHDPVDSHVVSLSHRGMRTVGAGTGTDGPGLATDVEYGPHGKLYALLQGVWDLPVLPENEGQPPSANSGAIVRVERDGSFTPVVSGLDRPTSLDFVGDTAFVVTLEGKVLRVDDVGGRHGRGH